MKKYNFRFKILETAVKGLLEYISIEQPTEKKDERENKYNDRQYRFLNGFYFVLTFTIYGYFMVIIESLHANVFATIFMGALMLPIVAFIVKLYVFDHNPFLHDADIEKYFKSENEFYLSCPMGYFNNARKLKIIFFEAHPFYKVQRIDGEDLNVIKAMYFNDQEMHEFYKISYSLIAEIEIVTAIRSCIWIVAIVELLVLIIDLLVSQAIVHTDTHMVNLVSFIVLSFIHTIYYFRTKGKYSKNRSYVAKAKKLKLKFNRHIRAS